MSDYAALDAAIAALTAARAALETPAPPSNVRRVKAGENLQAALDAGGRIELEPGVIWEGSYIVRSGTRLDGHGARLHGLTGPALIIEPGVSDIGIVDFVCTSAHPEVITIGENSSMQTTIAQAPRDITLERVIVPTHRGKRAFAVHAANVSLLDCEALDVWDPGGQDSQAIYCGNAPGPITIRGGRYSAGSEVILFGGGSTMIPDLTPSDVLIEGVELFRPLSWQTDGVARKVKNLLELKNARRVTIRHSKLHGCWLQGQGGEAFVLTPALDGAPVDTPLQSGTVRDVLIEDCEVYDVAAGFNITGRDYAGYTPEATSVTVRRLTLTASAETFGGNRGNLATIGGEPESVRFEDCAIDCDGWSLIYAYTGSVLDPVTHQSRMAGKIGTLALTGSNAPLGEYSLNIGGNPNARNWQQFVGVMDVTNNQFRGAKTLRALFPDNTYS